MSRETKLDTLRAMAAMRELVDGRDIRTQSSAILVTLEHLCATILLGAMDLDPRKAAAMLNEGLVHGIEARLAGWTPERLPKMDTP